MGNQERKQVNDDEKCEQESCRYRYGTGIYSQAASRKWLRQTFWRSADAVDR